MHSRQATRPFTAADVHFLETVGNVLAAAIERTRTEDQLREKEAQYRGIFEATSDGVVISDLAGRVVEANPAYCAMFGYHRDELIGLSTRALRRPDSALGSPAEAPASAPPRASWESSMGMRKDGSMFLTEVLMSAFTYGGTPHHLEVARDVTERVRAFALLEQRVAERTRELSALLGVSHTVASTLEIEPLLGLILDQLQMVVAYTGAAIFVVEGDDVRVLDYRGPLQRERMRDLRIPVARAVGYQAVRQRNGPVILDDLKGSSLLAQDFQGLQAHLRATIDYARSVLIVPLTVKERLIGVLRIDHDLPDSYTPRHAELAVAFANQAAVAIENARLYGRAQEAAVLEERQRLARELHDSVTQALYGATLYAEAAARLLVAGDHATAAAYVRDLGDTTQEALREMRLLLFELRPADLARDGLATALRTRLAAVEERVPGLSTIVEVDEDIHLSSPIEEALYGVAREALNNALKHAGAGHIRLSLRRVDATVVLEITDDGIGFDPAAVKHEGGFGVRGMAERVERAGGSLALRSTPGRGTMVRVEVTP